MENQNRDFEIPYSKQDMKDNYKKFKLHLGLAKGIKGKKLRREIKKYRWYDYAYINRYLLNYSRCHFKKEHRYLNERLDYLGLVVENEVYYRNKKSLLPHIYNLFKHMEKYNPEYLKGLKYFIKYLEAKHYYEGNVIDSETKEICDTMEEFAQALDANSIAKASALYVKNYDKWWD